MQIKNIISVLETFAPLKYQESYDNCGVQVGDVNRECTGALLTLDVTEAVIDEALSLGCNLIIAHHPLIFSGLKKITGRNFVEKCIIKAIQNNITIYAVHTNLDNMPNGVNKLIADKLGLKQVRILSPTQNNLLKLYTYAPLSAVEKVRKALFDAGAGHIGNYYECSFNTEGTGTFRPNELANPTIGTAGGAMESVAEVKIEVLVPAHLQNKIIAALMAAHPYEEVAYELIALENKNQTIGAGMIGILPEEHTPEAFLKQVKTAMDAACIRHTAFHKNSIKKVAVCGGSGSFLLPEAIAQGADIFITGDFKYHQFFDAEGKIIIADIGHWETEHFTPEIFLMILNENFSNFAVYLSKLNTNPINYYF